MQNTKKVPLHLVVCQRSQSSSILAISNIHLGPDTNQTTPKPVLPKPREPSTKEREEAVQFSIPPEGDVSSKPLFVS